MASERDELDLVILADVHYVNEADHICPVPTRNAPLGRELVDRAWRRIQRSGTPDAIVVMGDLVDNGEAADAERDLAALKAQLEKTGVPVVAVPGNHDGDPDRLLGIFDDRPGLHEIKGHLLVTFADRYDPEDRSARSTEGLALIREVASGRPNAPLLAFQHNPIHPPIESSYPYNLTNSSEVMRTYAESGVVLSVSGHLHPGSPLDYVDGVGYVVCPALCEAPFRFLRIRVRGREVAVWEESLGMPDEPPLVDVHVHTQYAYCATTVTATGAIDRAEKFGLSGIVLTEHAGHLYVSREDPWWSFLNDPDMKQRCRAEGRDRMSAYRAEMGALRSSSVRLGLEVECDRDGELALLDEDRAGWDLMVGAVHELPGAFGEHVESGFMAVTEKLLQHQVAVLAHPFRFFRRHKMEIPRHLFRPVARLLAEYGAAAEINFHTNEPNPAFFRCCLEESVPIALGSDAHALYEVGEFGPHMEVLREAGAGEVLGEVLFSL